MLGKPLTLVSSDPLFDCHTSSSETEDQSTHMWWGHKCSNASVMLPLTVALWSVGGVSSVHCAYAVLVTLAYMHLCPLHTVCKQWSGHCAMRMYSGGHTCIFALCSAQRCTLPALVHSDKKASCTEDRSRILIGILTDANNWFKVAFKSILLQNRFCLLDTKSRAPFVLHVLKTFWGCTENVDSTCLLLDIWGIHVCK